MTSYSASVGATPQVISGTLNWNPNGTLLSNNISDAYNSANTQNCAYVYDDFIRVASVNCANGSTNIWNQNFTYGSDAFGNLTKSVPTGGIGDSWPPSGGGYNASTNQYTGITGVTYDADGDLLTDTFHTYTWLADGHVGSVATGTSTTSIVYDAEGNKVEENSGSGGSLHEYVSAFGISAQMTGQTETSATVNLPGGLEALYSLDLLVRFRFPDWQGSIRAESSLSRAFTESVAFAPFGERYAVKGAPFNVDSFTGKPDQIASDEYDFEARELHDGQGRWISPDPMKGTGNKYAYADNNPLSNVDLYGFIVLTSEVEQNPNTVDQQFQNLSSGAESHPPDPEQTGSGGCMTCTEQTNQGQPGDAPQEAQAPSAQQHVQVTETVTEQPSIVQNKELPDGTHVTGVGGTVTDTMTVNGKPLSNVDVSESNVNTLTVNGEPANVPTREGSASTNNAGQLGDTVGAYAPAGTASQDAGLVHALNTNSVVYTNKNTIAFTVPGGATYTATDTRILTNVGANGAPSSHYTLSISPVVIKTGPQ